MARDVASDELFPKVKSWNIVDDITDITDAGTSYDGRFVAITASDKKLCVVALKNIYEEVFEDVLSFSWGRCNWKTEVTLTYPTEVNFITVLDSCQNIRIFGISKNEHNTYKSVSYAKIDANSIFAEFEKVPLLDFCLIATIYNTLGTEHEVCCLVNRKHLFKIVIPIDNTPAIKQDVCLCEQNTDGLRQLSDVQLHTYHRELLYFVTNDKLLIILSFIDFQLLKQLNLYDMCITTDVLHFDVLGTENIFVAIVDEHHNIHITDISKMLTVQRNPILSPQKSPSYWKHRLKAAKVNLKNSIADPNLESRVIPSPNWMHNFSMTTFVASNQSLFFIYNDDQSGKERFIGKYDLSTDEFEVKELPFDICLCGSPTSYIPMFFVSPSLITVGLFDVTQEQLIDTIIQHSDIAQAELICKSNKWNQFSIPLHTLEVGLQHRQLDTIIFFLKSRERVFSRYWRSYCDQSVTNNGSSPPKSVSSQKSYTELVGSDEMFDVIEMLLDGCSYNSKGKHHQNFFDGLLNVTLKYCNSLLQDGITALDIKVNIDNENKIQRSASHSSTNRSFSFLYDIKETLQYITEKIIDLRTHLKVPLLEYEPIDSIDGECKTADSADFKELAVNHLLKGDVGSAQILFYSQNQGGRLEDVVRFGQDAVMNQIEQKNIENAEKILLNLGFVPQLEIKKIYLTTVKRSRRAYLFDVLKEKDCLSEQEIMDYEFLKELEQIYDIDDFQIAIARRNFQWDTNLKVNLPLPLSFTNAEGSTSLEGSTSMEGSTSLENASKKAGNTTSSCYCKLCLMDIKSWDEKTRKNILLDGVFIKDAQITLAQEHSDELWTYLQSHGQLSILQFWIEEMDSKKRKQIFPQFPSSPIINEEVMTNYMRESIMNCLVHHGYYPENLMENFPKLVKYISHNKLLFSGIHPMKHYKKRLTEHERADLMCQFNTKFLEFCQENDLLMLAFHFMSHYRLTPNDVKFSDKMKTWFAMLIHFYHVSLQTASTTDVNGHLLNALLMNSCYLNQPHIKTVGNYNLNEVVKDKQAVTALAIALVANVDIDTLLAGKDDANVYSIEKTLLEHYLRYFPKLHDILFKQTSAVHDISMYQLLEDNTEINISKCFTWQSMNNLALKDDYILHDLPHFSHPTLVERYANEITLEYDYYLWQGRPFFAYLVYLSKYKQYLKRNYTVAAVLKDTYRLAVENFTSHSITLSCSLFAELIEQNCEKIKIDTKVALFVKTHYLKRVFPDKKNSPRNLSKIIIDSLLNESDSSSKPLMNLLKMLEDSIEVIIHEKKLNRYSYEAVCQWQLAVRFCRLHQLPLTTRYMENCCHEENWLQLFLFIHFYQVPSDQVASVLNTTMKNRRLREHLLTIVMNTKEVQFVTSESKRKRKKSNKEIRTFEKAVPRDIRAQFYSRLGTVTTEHIQQSSSSTKNEQVISSERNAENKSESEVTQGSVEKDPTVSKLTKIPDDLIDIMLISSDYPQPAKMLCLYAIVTYQPLLPVFAACYENTNLVSCLCLWYICSINDDDRLELCQVLFDLKISSEDLTLALQNHQWQSRDLLTIVKFLLTKRYKYAKLITQGFLIFKQNDLLTYLLQALESHLHLKPTNQTAKLMERFQSEYQSYRCSKVVGKESVDIYFCEHFAYQSIMTVIESSTSQYELYQFTKPLAESKFGYTFTIKVPDFVMIKKTADIVYHTNIEYSIKSLYNVDGLNEEINKIFDLLLDGGHFGDANDLAALHNLNTSKILSKKAFHEVDLISQTTAWKTIEIRSGYWKKINEMFLENNCDVRIGGDFFKYQAMREPSSYLAGERAALLLVALHWYGKDASDTEKREFAVIEKDIWMFRIKAQLENKNGMCIPDFDLCFDKRVDSLEGTYNDMSVSDDVVELLQSEDLSFTCHDDDVPILNDEEEKALEELIGVLLDDNCITEARRLSRYFNKTSLDLDIVMTAILIAQNKRTVETLNDDIKQILAETTSRHISISGLLERSGSFSRPGSLSSNPTGASGCMVDFVFIEEVQNALEKLTLRVNHGKQSCQRVLVSFKIAKVLCTSYEDIVSDDAFVVLRKLLETNFDQRRTLAKQFIKAFGLSADQISTFVADTMIFYIKLLTGELTSETRSSVPSFEEIRSMVQFTDNSSLVATMIFDEAVRVSKSAEAINRPASNLAYEVELFIFSHFCFTMSCNMEGIANVLRTARSSAKTLASINQHNLLVRLLTGIGRFREMMYIIETLYNQHHFEILCRKNFPNENQLKIALLDFMKKYHPDDLENFNLISVGFGMYREFAQHLESTGRRQIKEIKSQLKTQSKDLVPGLEAIKRTFSYAADNYVKDDCLTPAQRCIRVSRLIKLQMELLPTGAVLLGLTRKEVEHFITTHLSFIESFIVVDSYEIREPSVWVEPLYQIVVVRSHFSYLQQFQSFIQLNPLLVSEVALRFRNDKNTASTINMKKFLSRFPDVKTKLKISKELNFSDVEKQLLEGANRGVFERSSVLSTFKHFRAEIAK